MDIKQIEKRLRQVDDQEVSDWLGNKIMAKIGLREQKLLHRLYYWFLKPFYLQVKPVQVTVIIGIALIAFWSGIISERSRNAGLDQEIAISNEELSQNARANYHVGRGLFAAGQLQSALSYFQKAAELDPNQADFSHWRGIAYGALGNTELERQSYYQTIAEKPDYIPSLLYLGHSYLENGKYLAAVQKYERVLQAEPLMPEALFNVALAYHKIGETSRERFALKRYLSTYRSGKWAHRAVERLHQLNDFVYRRYRLGLQQIIVNVHALLGSDPSAQQNEIAHVARHTQHLDGNTLHLVVFQKENTQAAKAMALQLRGIFLQQYFSDKKLPVRASWFDTEENMVTDDGSTAKLSPSLLLFTQPITTDIRRNST